jgi:hypothetical protein
MHTQVEKDSKANMAQTKTDGNERSKLVRGTYMYSAFTDMHVLFVAPQKHTKCTTITILQEHHNHNALNEFQGAWHTRSTIHEGRACDDPFRASSHAPHIGTGKRRALISVAHG